MIKATVHHIFTNTFWMSEWFDKTTAEHVLFDDVERIVFRDTDDVEVVIPKHIMDDCVVYFEEVGR